MLKRCPMCIQTLLLIPTIPGHLTKGPQRWSIEVIANANYLVNSSNTLMRPKFGKLKPPFSTSLVFNLHSACCSYLQVLFLLNSTKGRPSSMNLQASTTDEQLYVPFSLSPFWWTHPLLHSPFVVASSFQHWSEHQRSQQWNMTI